MQKIVGDTVLPTAFTPLNTVATCQLQPQLIHNLHIADIGRLWHLPSGQSSGA